MPETGAEILARINPQLDEDWTYIYLRPDLAAEREELEDKLAEELAETGGPGRLADRPSKWAVILAEQIEANKYLMDESAVRFVFRALPRAKFRALCDQYPPRKGNLADAAVGYDQSQLSEALVRTSLVEPVFDEESWEQLLDVMSIGEWNELQRRAEKVNGGVVTESPKSVLASAILSSLASDLEQPPASE